MKSAYFKYLYSVAMLVFLAWWANLLLDKTEMCMEKLAAGTLTSGNINEIAGVGAVMGAAITWNMMIVTFWFRKAGPQEKKPPESDNGGSNPP